MTRWSRANAARIMKAIDTVETGIDDLRVMLEEVLPTPADDDAGRQEGDKQGKAGPVDPPTFERERLSLLAEIEQHNN